MTADAGNGDRQAGSPEAAPLNMLGGEGGGPGSLVAFDFDGTLTVRDSFNAYLLWRSPPLRTAAALLELAPAILLYLVDRDRGRLKTAAVRVFLKGLGRRELELEAEAFASATFDRLMRPDALAAWRRHGEQGRRRVIVTASPEPVIAPFARRLGADTLIGTRLAFDAADRVSGELDGPNCRGAEKVRRLRQAFGDDVRVIAAYGDTTGDREMLDFADRGMMKPFTAKPSARRPQR